LEDRLSQHSGGNAIHTTVVSYYPPADCPCCGGKVLAHDKPYRVHQVFDLPEVSYFFTEHQLFRATCSVTSPCKAGSFIRASAKYSCS
jgi:hypothetical protein